MLTEKHSITSLPFGILLGLASGACVPEFEDDLSRIETPRLLAVRAEPAEVRAGQRTQLSVFVADPTGSFDTSDLDFNLCVARKSLKELGPVEQECLTQFGTDTDLLLPLGAGSNVEATLPADVCRQFGPQAPIGPDGRASGRAVDPDLSGGYYQPVVVGKDSDILLGAIRAACGSAGLLDREVVRFNQGYRPNENPEVERLELRKSDGEEELVEPGTSAPGASVPAGSEIELRVSWPECPREPVCGDGICSAGENQVSCTEDCRDAPRGCYGAENYFWPNPRTRRAEERREGILVSWYASAGSFGSERTGRTERDPDGTDTTNSWIAPAEPGPVRLWVVLRDDRGGVGWQEYLLDIE